MPDRSITAKMVILTISNKEGTTMKSMLKSLMSVAAAALAFTSCSNDATEDVMPNVGTKTLKVNATIDQTRTVMADDHVKLDWAAEDEIILYIGKNGAKNIIKPLSGGTIKGVDYQEGETVYANYSIKNDEYSKGATEAEINIVTPQTQTAANEFAGTNLPMVASGEIKGGNVDLVFHPVGCVLVFNVYGPAANEKIKSIKFTTTKNCRGYKKCDLTAGLTAEALGFTETGLDGGGKSVEVKLTTYAPVDASKPADTKIGKNQIYMVVAPFNYTDGSFIVTTDAGEYTFTTKNGIDCSTSTARVVNLNLAKATTGFSPEIIVPAVDEQPADEVNNLLIDGIVLKNITASDVNVAVYSDKELTAELTESWLTIPNTATLASGKLYCDLLANTDATPRTVYIGIKYGDVQAAIAVKQVGAGSTPAVKAVATYTPSDATYGYNNAQEVSEVKLNNSAVTLNFAKGSNSSGNSPKYYTDDSVLRCYTGNTITVESTMKILKIEIVRFNGGSKNDATLSANVGKLSGSSTTSYTWTGENNKVVLTLNTGRQYHIESMEITYVKGSSETPDPTPDPDQPDPDQPIAGNTASLTLADISASNLSGSAYTDFSITATDGSVWTGNCMGNKTRLQLGKTNNSGSSNQSYILVPEADKVIKKITFTPESGTRDNCELLLLPEDFTYTKQNLTEIREAAYAGSTKTVNGSTTPISIDLTGKNLKRFMIRAVNGTFYLTNITIEYAE